MKHQTLKQHLVRAKEQGHDGLCWLFCNSKDHDKDCTCECLRRNQAKGDS